MMKNYMTKKLLIFLVMLLQGSIVVSGPVSNLNVSFLALDKIYPINVTSESNFCKWLLSIIKSSMFIDCGDKDYFTITSVIIPSEDGYFFKCIPQISNEVILEQHDPKTNKTLNLYFNENRVKKDKLIFELVNLDNTQTIYFRLIDAKFFTEINCNNEIKSYACGETFHSKIQENLNKKLIELIEMEKRDRSQDDHLESLERMLITKEFFELKNIISLNDLHKKEVEQRKLALMVDNLIFLENSVRLKLQSEEYLVFSEFSQQLIQSLKNMEQKHKISSKNLSSVLLDETEPQQNPLPAPIDKKDESKTIGFGKFFVIFGLSGLFYVLIKHSNVIQKIKKSKPKTKSYENNKQIEPEKEEKKICKKNNDFFS